MLDLACYLPYIGSSQMGRERVERMDVDGMLAQSCGRMGVGFTGSTLEQDMATTVCFGSRQFGKPRVIRCASGIRMYTSLYGDKSVERRYGG